eukprot:COSAG02_NODE_561_length_20308_cov_42.799495_17_plen_56_part_00
MVMVSDGADSLSVNLSLTLPCSWLMTASPMMLITRIKSDSSVSSTMAWTLLLPAV